MEFPHATPLTHVLRAQLLRGSVDETGDVHQVIRRCCTTLVRDRRKVSGGCRGFFNVQGKLL